MRDAHAYKKREEGMRKEQGCYYMMVCKRILSFYLSTNDRANSVLLISVLNILT